MRIGDFVVLVKKDLLLELRSKEMLSVLLSLSLLFATVLSLSLQSAFVNEITIRKLFPGMIWFLFIVTASVGVGRTAEYEVRHRAGEGILLTAVSSAMMFLSKTTSTAFFVAVGHLLGVLTLSLFLDTAIVAWGPFLIISVLVLIGYSALSTLLSAMTATSKLNNLLLPLLLVPLLFPIFLGAIELTTVMQDEGRLACESFWFSLLGGLDLVFLAVGVTLYEFVIHE